MKHFTMKSPYEFAVMLWGAFLSIITFASNLLEIPLLWDWQVTLDKLAALCWAALVAGIGAIAAVLGKKITERYWDKWFGKKDKNDK